MNSSTLAGRQKSSVMWLRDMVQGLLRRWYVLLVSLLVVGVAAFMVYQGVPNSYSAKVTMVLMPPQSSVGVNGNPYLLLGGMNQALDILSAKMSAPDTQEPMMTGSPNVSFEIMPDRTNSGPVLLATVRGQNQREVMSALETVETAIPRALAALQDSQGVPANSRIGLMSLVRDTRPASETKAKTVSVLFTAGGGAVMAILLTGFIDGRLLARTRTSSPQKAGTTRRNRPASSKQRSRETSSKLPLEGARSGLVEPGSSERIAAKSIS